MKVKSAADLIRDYPPETKHKLLCDMFGKEVDDRIQLRAHGKKPTDNLIAGVVDEVCDWANKVGKDAGMLEDSIKLAVDYTRGVMFAKYKCVDPTAAKSMVAMRQAVLRGKHPIDVLTMEGLDAITGMMLGSMVRVIGHGEEGAYHIQMTKLANEMKLSSRPLCPYEINAIGCKHQETLFDKRNGLPTSTSQLQFFCKHDPKKCDYTETRKEGK